MIYSKYLESTNLSKIRYHLLIRSNWVKKTLTNAFERLIFVHIKSTGTHILNVKWDRVMYNSKREKIIKVWNGGMRIAKPS